MLPLLVSPPHHFVAAGTLVSLYIEPFGDRVHLAEQYLEPVAPQEGEVLPHGFYSSCGGGEYWVLTQLQCDSPMNPAGGPAAHHTAKFSFTSRDSCHDCQHASTTT